MTLNDAVRWERFFIAALSGASSLTYEDDGPCPYSASYVVETASDIADAALARANERWMEVGKP